jgi:DNA repair protein RadA/Sms
MVDTVLYFEGERNYDYRILRSIKNRFGPTNEIGIFSMVQDGLEEVLNPSELFLPHHQAQVSGTSIFAGLEGTRPILCEIQALVAPSYLGSPRRNVVGWDQNRLSMILAVLETRCGLPFGNKDIFLNVAGGLKVQEPGCDLAAAAALISAFKGIPTPASTIYFGEIGLSGEIRSVSHAEQRIKEAEKLGFSKLYTSHSLKPISSSFEVSRLYNVLELIP